MKASYKIIFAVAALFAAVGCEHKELGWPEPVVLYPTNLQADLLWNTNKATANDDVYPGTNEELYYYFFDNAGKLVHFGKEKTIGDPATAEPVNWKYHIDYVHKDNIGYEHYLGTYHILCSENEMLEIIDENTLEYEFIEGANMPDNAVPVVYKDGPNTYGQSVSLADLAFSGMDVSNVYNDFPDYTGYTGYKTDVVCGTTVEPVGSVYETTHADVPMNVYHAKDIKFKIYRNLNGGNTGLSVNKYAFADGLYSVFQGKKLWDGGNPFEPVTVYFGGDEAGDWRITGIQDSYKYTATSFTYDKPSGKLYLFCDFYQKDPDKGAPFFIVRYRICKVVDYTSLVQEDAYVGYIGYIENGYPTETESGLLDFYNTYCPGGVWRTDVTYPITKVIE